MQIELSGLLSYVGVLIVGFLIGQLSGEKRAFLRSQEQKQREEASNAWMEALKKMGGGQ